MSTLTQFAGGGVKSIQTGYVATNSYNSGVLSGEDDKYIDVTISPVANITKCFVTFDGRGTNAGFISNYSSSPTYAIWKPTIKVLNNITIRIMHSYPVAGNVYTAGRWTLVEYN